MSHPVLQLANASNWILFYRQYFRVRFLGPTTYEPLAPITLPVQSEHRILVAGCTSQTAKSTWYLGGWLRPVIDTGATDFGFAELDRVPIPLNAPRLVMLPQVASNYKLRFEVPYWHQEITLTVYQYIGPDVDSTEVLIDSLQADLSRIESKIDHLT